MRMPEVLYQQRLPAGDCEAIFACPRCPEARLRFVFRKGAGRLLIQCRECCELITAVAIADRTVRFSPSQINRVLIDDAVDPSFRKEAVRILTRAAAIERF